MIPYTDWMRVVEDGVEAGEVWVRIGSVGFGTTDFQIGLEGNAPVDSHVSR